MKKLLLGLVLAFALPLAAQADSVTLTCTATPTSDCAYTLTTTAVEDITVSATWTQTGDLWTFSTENIGDVCSFDFSALDVAGSPGYFNETCPQAPAGTHDIVFHTVSGSMDITMTIDPPSRFSVKHCNPKTRKC